MAGLTETAAVKGNAVSALELIAVTKSYGETIAVNAIDHVFPSASYCCLLGPSGCGKSSTLRMIAGHERVSSGDVILGAANITDLPPAKRGTAMMFQNYALFPHLTVLDNVAFSHKMQGIDKASRHARAMELLALVDMQDYARRVPDELSGGQQQRVAVARAMVGKPAIVLADEPTANLDSATGAALLDLMRGLNAEHGMTFVFSTHDPMVMERARRVIHLRDGRVEREERRP